MKILDMIKSFLITLSVGVLFSCNTKPEKNNVLQPDYLSEWFIDNEDSLYAEFTRYVYENSFCDDCDTTWGEMAYQKVDSSSYMGRFSLAAKKYADSIDVVYFYNKSTSPKERILLTTNYNKRYTNALDTIFNHVPSPKHFRIDKYEQPDTRTDVFGIDEGYVIVNDLRIESIPFDTLQNLIIFIHTKSNGKVVSGDNEDYLKRKLFGEELLLKRVNDITFKFSDSINTDLLSLDEVRRKLNIK